MKPIRGRSLLSLVIVFLILAIAFECGSETRIMPEKGAGSAKVFAATSAIQVPSIFAVPFFPESFAEGEDECPSDFEEQVLFLVNYERSLRGLSILELDVRLQTAARWMSDDMADHDGLPGDHVDSLGRLPAERVAQEGGYPHEYLGEVIAGGYPTPKAVVAAWMDSSGHRAILLGLEYDHIGVGYTYAPGTGYVHYWAADLGSTSDQRHAPPSECDPGFYRIFCTIVMK